MAPEQSRSISQREPTAHLRQATQWAPSKRYSRRCRSLAVCALANRQTFLAWDKHATGVPVSDLGATSWLHSPLWRPVAALGQSKQPRPSVKIVQARQASVWKGLGGRRNCTCAQCLVSHAGPPSRPPAGTRLVGVGRSAQRQGHNGRQHSLGPPRYIKASAAALSPACVPHYLASSHHIADGAPPATPYSHCTHPHSPDLLQRQPPTPPPCRFS